MLVRRGSPLLAAAALAFVGSGCSCNSTNNTSDDAGLTDAGPLDAPVSDAPPTPDASPTPDAPPTPDATPGSLCSAPILLEPGEGFSGDTTGFPATRAGSCSPASTVAPEMIFLFDLGPDPVDLVTRVSVDETVEAPFDVVLYARTNCPASMTEIGCADVGYGDRLELLAQSGSVYYFVDGTDQFGGEKAGAFDLETSVRAIVGEDAACDPAGLAARCETGFRCSGSTCVADSAELACAEAIDLTAALAAGSGTAETTGQTFLYAADFFAGSCAFDPEASFAEALFRFDVAETSDLVATTDFPETDFDTYLYIRSGACDGPELGCHDDVDVEEFNLKSRLEVPALAPGTYFLFVDGSSASPGTGAFRLRVTLTAD